MLTIKLDNEKYSVPNDISEFTITDFAKIMSVPKNEDKYERISEILHQVFDWPYEFINKISTKAIMQITTIINSCIADINEPLQNVFEFEGKKYKYFETTDVLRWDQFVDLVEMTKDEGTIVKNLHLIIM